MAGRNYSNLGPFAKNDWPTSFTNEDHVRNLFQYNDQGTTKHVGVFELSNTQLRNLLLIDANLNIWANQIRLHLSCNSNIPKGTVTEEPAFNFIVDAYRGSADNAMRTSQLAIQKSALPQFIPTPPETGKAAISWQVAKQLDDDFIYRMENMDGFCALFKKYVPNDEGGGTYLDDVIVTAYIVPRTDVDAIVQALQDDTENELKLFIRLGGFNLPLDELPEGGPFIFRPILELGSEMMDYSTRGSSNNMFFEFSHPCPPYCDDFADQGLEVPNSLQG